MVDHAFKTLALGRQRQMDLSEFEASLVYKASSLTARPTQRSPASKKTRSLYIALAVPELTQ